MADRESNYERRQGMRARDGWVWGNWLTCTEAEAQRVSGLHSWQVRQVVRCPTCNGTGRAPRDLDEHPAAAGLRWAGFAPPEHNSAAGVALPDGSQQ